MKVKLIIIIITSTFLGCVDKMQDKNAVLFKDGKQIPIYGKASTDVIVDAPDSVIVGEEFCANIRWTNSNHKLIKAYAQCDFDKSLVDTSAQTIDNCEIKLLVKGDTTFFCVTPSKASDMNVYKIALLTKDNLNVFSLDTLDLKFISTEKTNP